MPESQKFTPEEEIDQALENIDASMGDLEGVSGKSDISERLRIFTNVRDRNKKTKRIIKDLNHNPSENH